MSFYLIGLGVGDLKIGVALNCLQVIGKIMGVVVGLEIWLWSWEILAEDQGRKICNLELYGLLVLEYFDVICTGF